MPIIQTLALQPLKQTPQFFPSITLSLLEASPLNVCLQFKDQSAQQTGAGLSKSAELCILPVMRKCFNVLSIHFWSSKWTLYRHNSDWFHDLFLKVSGKIFLKWNFLYECSFYTRLYHCDQALSKAFGDYKIRFCCQEIFGCRVNAASKLQCISVTDFQERYTTLVLLIWTWTNWSAANLPWISFELSSLFSVSSSSLSLFFTESFVCSTPLRKITHAFFINTS